MMCYIVDPEEHIPILIQLESGDDNVARMNADGSRRAIRLVPCNSLDMDHPLLTVDLGDLALPTLVLAPNDANLIILADGNRPYLHSVIN